MCGTVNLEHSNALSQILGHWSHVWHGNGKKAGRAKADAAKRKRDAGPDILNPQIQASGAMDEALDTDNTAKHSIKGQEA